MHIRDFVAKGGVFLAATNSAEALITNGLVRGVTAVRPGTTTRVVGSLLRTRVADDASPVMYGVPDNLAVYSANGSSFNAGGGAGGARGAAARRRRRCRAGRRRAWSGWPRRRAWDAGHGPRHARRSGCGAGPTRQ